MRVTQTDLQGVLLIEPRVFADERGYFMETFHASRYAELGLPPMVQDNLAESKGPVLRGLHMQHPRDQGKLVYALAGSIFDVAVDARRGSPTFGKWVGYNLSAENHLQLWIPPGFLHGYCLLSPTALVAYKCTDLYDPKAEVSVRFDDPHIGVQWPISNPLVSPKDLVAKAWHEVVDRFPAFPS